MEFVGTLPRQVAETLARNAHRSKNRPQDVQSHFRQANPQAAATATSGAPPPRHLPFTTFSPPELQKEEEDEPGPPAGQNHLPQLEQTRPSQILQQHGVRRLGRRVLQQLPHHLGRLQQRQPPAAATSKRRSPPFSQYFLLSSSVPRATS